MFRFQVWTMGPCYTYTSADLQSCLHTFQQIQIHAIWCTLTFKSFGYLGNIQLLMHVTHNHAMYTNWVWIVKRLLKIYLKYWAVITTTIMQAWSWQSCFASGLKFCLRRQYVWTVRRQYVWTVYRCFLLWQYAEGLASTWMPCWFSTWIF